MTDDNIAKLFSSSLEGILGGEDLLIEVAREMIKDEIKEKVRASLEEDPDLRKEFKGAVELYYESKLRQTLAAARIAKASTRLGIKLAPRDLQEEIQKEVEKEIARIIDDTL